MITKGDVAQGNEWKKNKERDLPNKAVQRIKHDRWSGSFQSLLQLGKPQLRQRSQRISSANIRNDTQLEHSDRW